MPSANAPGLTMLLSGLLNSAIKLNAVGLVPKYILWPAASRAANHIKSASGRAVLVAKVGIGVNALSLALNPGIENQSWQGHVSVIQ